MKDYLMRNIHQKKIFLNLISFIEKDFGMEKKNVI